MNCKKSVIYLANTVSTSVVSGGTITLPTTVRRRGCRFSSNGSGASIAAVRCDEYYDAYVNVTFTAVAAGNVTISLVQDGTAVVGANQTVTVTTDGTQSVAVSFPAVVRVNACNTSALSITSSAAITVTNAALKVVED